jgi:multidrug efflux pump subunit AcrA (membrane-fusion protein)
MKKTLSIILSVLLILFFVGCTKTTQSSQAPQEALNPQEVAQQTVFAVNAFLSYKGDLNGYLEFGGDVSAVSSVDVLPDTSGKISRIYVSVGDVVKKDQVLAEVDASRPGMTYSASPVKAPVAGTVTSFASSVGNMVAPSMAIGRISSTDKLEIKTSVPERFISKIKLNQKAILTFDAYPGETFTAKVTKISPVLDTSTRTMSVTLVLDPPDSKIKIGMYARIKLITDHKSNAIIIPTSALVTRSSEQCVFVVNEDNTVTLKKVTVGIKVDDMVEILNGLEGNEKVVTKGQTLLNNGTKVNIVSLTEEKIEEK